MSSHLDAVNIVVDDSVLFDQPNTVIGDPNGGFFINRESKEFGLPARFNNTALIIQSNYGKDGWFFSFDGTSISLYGITPPLSFSQNIAFATFPFDTKSDLSTSDPATYNITKYSQPAFGGLLFSTPTLPDGASAIEIGLTGAAGIIVDYAVVSVGNLTDLRSQTIILDDTSPEIFWNGSWTGRSDLILDVPSIMPFDTQFNESGATPFTASMRPHENTTHETSRVGDGFVFQFSGSAPLVSGVTPSSDSTGSDWLLSMSFTLYTTNSSDVPTTVITNFTRDVTDSTRPHFTYFSAPLLPKGDHTLVGRILAVAGTPTPQAQIDYITYQPAFATVNEKPKFDPAKAALTLGNQSEGATSSSTSPSSSATQSNTPPSTKSNHSKHAVAAIAGGVVGGIGFIILVLLVAFWLWRRKSRRRVSEDSETFGQPAPFIGLQIPTTQLSLAGPPFKSPQSNFSAPHTMTMYSQSSALPLVYEPYLNSPVVQTQSPGSIRTLRTTASLEGTADAAELQAHMRELQTQMAQLTHQLRHQTVVSLPPSYRHGALSDTLGSTEGGAV
ncbi:Gpr1 family protein [Mycena indigotica]|uniref:Gpr1 family protein n=1 Tax=Mycena indigotica TaxID=2126181 RepID=A0A8H6SWI0_9AGAR|nr:Gpr1 family protein [Mycena indigotica]KAF7307520.1 Gpr1 family protein [Mycena indigotica]